MKLIRDNLEVVTLSLLRKIDMAKKEGEEVILYLETDEEIVCNTRRRPLKHEEQRKMLASALKDVDYIIFDGKIINIRNPNENECKKRYKVGYVPGTYDLLHTGHLENIHFAKELCECVVVGVNGDELVWKNKKKQTRQTEATRLFVVDHLRDVDITLLATTNNKKAVSEVCEELTGYPIDAIFLGEDLRGNCINEEGGLEGVDYIYTERSKKKMETVSSTSVRRSLEEMEEEIHELKQRNRYLENLLKAINEQVE